MARASEAHLRIRLRAEGPQVDQLHDLGVSVGQDLVCVAHELHLLRRLRRPGFADGRDRACTCVAVSGSPAHITCSGSTGGMNSTVRTFLLSISAFCSVVGLPYPGPSVGRGIIEMSTDTSGRLCAPVNYI
ncbi:hypothetical protein PCANC_07328 [Puccinia coronata f. sp. avenae]|uniref:Uncharacterized protein n=1 Tax=Puccinia coronata f. sp. avenae TaxID=200324 RepID=A0A2N5T6C7_9BASI|nr:hypothetical protein PCANC_07328 [Puccinia coronata f. sp. avenae]